MIMKVQLERRYVKTTDVFERISVMIFRMLVHRIAPLVQARHGTTPTGRGMTVALRAAMLPPIEIPWSTTGS